MTAPMGEERLAQIAAIEAGVSAGPWLQGVDGYSVSGPEEDGLSALQVAIDVGDPADAAFIAMARDAVPELLAEVRRYREMFATEITDVTTTRTEKGKFRVRYLLNGNRKSSVAWDDAERANEFIQALTARHGGTA